MAVASARTASASTSPVDAFTPEGTSHATTGASASLIAAIAPATGSRGSPSKPVPSIASTITPEPVSSSAANGRGGSPGSRSRLTRASPFVSARSPTASTSTSRPSSRRRRATTRPSPPLLPLPQTTRTGPGSRDGGRDPREPDPRALHQVDPGDAALLDRPRVGGAHLRRLVQGVEPVRQAHATIATAPGGRAGVRQRDRTRRGRPRAPRAVPVSRTAGALPVATTSTSRNAQPPRPSALPTASFAQKRAARCCPGRARAAAYSSSASVNSRSREPRPALERALEPLDLQQVDADPGHAERA